MYNSEFEIGAHRFRIQSWESCMIRYVVLTVAYGLPGKEYGESSNALTGNFVEIYEIEEHDHVWNTLVADREKDGIISIVGCIEYLKMIAKEFADTHPERLAFGSEKKALSYGEQNLKKPLRFREPKFRYPGT